MTAGVKLSSVEAEWKEVSENHNRMYWFWWSSHQKVFELWERDWWPGHQLDTWKTGLSPCSAWFSDVGRKTALNQGEQRPECHILSWCSNNQHIYTLLPSWTEDLRFWSENRRFDTIPFGQKWSKAFVFTPMQNKTKFWNLKSCHRMELSSSDQLNNQWITNHFIQIGIYSCT